MISSFSVTVVNTAFAGHLGNSAIMAGVGMAAMYCNITCNSLMIGLNSTLNTLLSQAVGFNDFRLCGVYLNRSRIALTIMYLPLALILTQTQRIFLAVGFDPEASAYSQEFINMIILGFYFMGLIDNNRRFL